ncbi:MAG: ABC transporter permease subunit [Myxococcota bacterium]
MSVSERAARGERIVAVAFTVAGYLPLLVTAALIAVLVRGLLGLSGALNLAVLAALGLNSIKVVSMALVVGLPVGLGLAVYLNEYGSDRLRRRIKPLIELMAAVPTVVWGYFALLAVTPILSRLIPGLPPLNSISAAIAVGFMILPTFATLCDDALHDVPATLREAAYALGADRTSTALRVVLPSASWGLTAALLLTLARAMGESMIVLIAAGQVSAWSADPRSPGLTLPAAIAEFSLNTASGDRTLFAAGAMLLLAATALSITAFRIVHRRQIR